MSITPSTMACATWTPLGWYSRAMDWARALAPDFPAAKHANRADPLMEAVAPVTIRVGGYLELGTASSRRGSVDWAKLNNPRLVHVLMPFFPVSPNRRDSHVAFNRTIQILQLDLEERLDAVPRRCIVYSRRQLVTGKLLVDGIKGRLEGVNTVGVGTYTDCFAACCIDLFDGGLVAVGRPGEKSNGIFFGESDGGCPPCTWLAKYFMLCGSPYIPVPGPAPITTA